MGGSGRAVPLGIGGFVILLLLSWATGTDFLSLFTQQGSPSQTVGTSGDRTSTPAEERMVDFVDAVTNDVQNTWAGLLGGRYQRTQVVLFRDAIQSACGSADAGDRSVLLSRRSEGLPRSRFLRRALAAVRRAGRFRAGVCDRPRDSATTCRI